MAKQRPLHHLSSHVSAKFHGVKLTECSWKKMFHHNRRSTDTKLMYLQRLMIWFFLIFCSHSLPWKLFFKIFRHLCFVSVVQKYFRLVRTQFYSYVLILLFHCYVMSHNPCVPWLHHVTTRTITCNSISSCDWACKATVPSSFLDILNLVFSTVDISG